MKQSTRLIINSAATFGRMAITIGISLTVTRLLLRTLGEIDFGLIVALGATGALLQFVTSGLSASVQRQFSYAIGRKDVARLNQVFSTAWVVFVSLAAGLWLLGQAISPLIMHGLTIPPERADAAWWVYQLTLVSLVLAVTATPYQAMIIAHQHVFINAIADTITALIRLASVLTIAIAPWDRMVTYVALQLAGSAIVRWSLTAYCLLRFDGSRPRPREFDRAELKQIFGIAGWTLVGDLSWRLRMQGGTLLLNVFFGPVINGSYGIAIQVVGYVMNVAQAMRLAVLPAIVGAEAKGNRQNVHRLALVAGKYVVLLLSLVFVPLWLEAAQMLRLWLGNLPPMTVLLTRIALIWALAYVFNIGQRLALLATGNMGWYGRITIVMSVSVLVVAATLFQLGLGPWALPMVEVVSVLTLMVIEAVYIGREIDMPVWRWLREAILPALAVLVPATAAAALVHASMAEDLRRLVAVTAAYGAVAMPLIWFVALAPWERTRFLGFAGSALARLQRAN
jgi:O-antigen/teichoic acid export membrane protein